MSQSECQHRRDFTRVAVAVSADIITSVGLIRAVRLRDVGLTGVFVLVSECLPLGTQCRVVLTLEEDGPKIEAFGRVIRTEGTGMAIEFTEIHGLDSLEHLRNLVRFNTTQPGQIEKEFASHLGIKRDA